MLGCELQGFCKRGQPWLATYEQKLINLPLAIAVMQQMSASEKYRTCMHLAPNGTRAANAIQSTYTSGFCNPTQS